MRGNIATVTGTVICLAVLAAWFYTFPSFGSNLILFAAFLCTGYFLDSIRKSALRTAASAFISAASGTAWYFHRDQVMSLVTLFLSLLCALVAIDSGSRMLSAETQRKK